VYLYFEGTSLTFNELTSSGVLEAYTESVPINKISLGHGGKRKIIEVWSNDFQAHLLRSLMQAQKNNGGLSVSIDFQEVCLIEPERLASERAYPIARNVTEYLVSLYKAAKPVL